MSTEADMPKLEVEYDAKSHRSGKVQLAGMPRVARPKPARHTFAGLTGPRHSPSRKPTRCP